MITGRAGRLREREGAFITVNLTPFLGFGSAGLCFRTDGEIAEQGAGYENFDGRRSYS